MGKVIILPETSEKPITLIGSRAGYCWGADVSDNEKNYKRGLDCIESNHGRTLEYVNVEMVLDGYSARVIREWYTHIGGAPTRLQASTRYINYADFEYVTPKKIEANPEAKAIYDSIMEKISEVGRELEALGIPREDSAMILPLGMTTKIVDRRNLRNLIDMSRQRMCTRAYWEYRELFSDICKALSEYSEEWKQIIDSQMMPKCELLGYCPERYCCGRKPKKNQE
ncbi:MAG: FAD-dependent thymidylate synthase [Clostridia bacterium]|nr:FAD-dependent thymidylate synthase [Clostridia bacterium]